MPKCSLCNWLSCWLILIMMFLQTADASDSFRLENGNLIRTGLTKLELLAIVGPPMTTEDVMQRVERPQNSTTQQIITSHEVLNEQRLTYQLAGSIGGDYLVEVTIRQGKVTAIHSVQLNR